MKNYMKFGFLSLLSSKFFYMIFEYLIWKAGSESEKVFDMFKRESNFKCL